MISIGTSGRPMNDYNHKSPALCNQSSSKGGGVTEDYSKIIFHISE